ncbi:Uncharacterized protein QTN25_005640 [Entamoeba marina]
MTSTQTPAEPEYLQKLYVTRNLKEYKGYNSPNTVPNTSPQENQPPILLPNGKIFAAGYADGTINAPRNLGAFPNRPEASDYESYEDFEAAWKDWYDKAKIFSSNYDMPKPIGHELYIPTKTATIPLTSDTWDATLIPSEPQPSSYQTYDDYFNAVTKWIQIIPECGFLPPHATEIEKALRVKIETERKSDVAALGDILSAEKEGFADEHLFPPTEDCFYIKKCVKPIERRKYELNPKFQSALNSSSAHARLDKAFIVPPTLLEIPDDVLVVQGVDISLRSIVDKEFKNREEKSAKNDVSFKPNKRCKIFENIVEMSQKSEKDTSRCSSQKEENINTAIEIIRTEKPTFNALYKIIFFPISITDFNAILEASVDGRTIKQIFLECLYSPNIIWYFKLANQTICPYTLTKLSSFGKEVLLHHGKTLLQQFILGNKDINFYERLEIFYGAAKLLGRGYFDVFQLNVDVIQQLKELLACGDLIEQIHLIYYLNIIANCTSRDSNLKDLVKSSVTQLSQSEKEVLDLFNNLSKGMQIPDLAPLSMFCIQQLIGIGDVQVMRYLQTLKKFLFFDTIQNVVTTEFQYSNYCATLIMDKVMITKDSRCQLLEQISKKDSVSSLRTILTVRTPDHVIHLLCLVIRYAIKNCMSVVSNDSFWKEFTGDYFFADFCLPILADAFENANESLMDGIISVIKTLLKESLKNNRLGKNCKGDSDKFNSIEVSFTNIEELLKPFSKINSDEKMKKYQSHSLFANLIDCFKIIYSVHEQCVLLFENKACYALVGLSTLIFNTKEKVSPNLLDSTLQLYVTIVSVLSQHPARIPTPNQPLTNEEKQYSEKQKKFFDDFFNKILRMKGNSQSSKHWNYVSFYAKEASLQHSRVVLKFVRSLLNCAFNSECEIVAEELKVFLGETMFSETTSLKMLIQQASNTAVTTRDVRSFKKGYNCITYPSVMLLANFISCYQKDKKLVKKVLGEGSSEAQGKKGPRLMIKVVPETGKKDVDGKSLILTVQETDNIRKRFLTLSGKPAMNVITLE